MNLLRLGWKNLSFKPGNSLLSILLFALGIGLISLLLQLQKQLDDNFTANLAGVDMVIGAKGSPLQLILSSMYHVDNPTGNITLKEARPFLNPKHPLIEAAIPLSMGDNFRGYRVVGTTADILHWYGGKVAQGEIWRDELEVTAGAKAAQALGLKVGDNFKSAHGLVDISADGMDSGHDHDFKLVGILEKTGTVLDQLLLTSPQTFWQVHEHSQEAEIEEAEEEHDHDHTHDHNHDHDDDHTHDHAKKETSKGDLLSAPDDKEITSILVKFKSRNFATLNFPRNINDNTDLQAATPAIEINRLFDLFRGGEQALQLLALIIIFVSGLSIFISLFSSLQERKYELALLRVMGYGRKKLFLLIILEGMLLATIGYIVGILLSRGILLVIGTFFRDSFRYDFSVTDFLPQEAWLLAGTWIIGFIAAFIPAVQAAQTDIAGTLNEQ